MPGSLVATVLTPELISAIIQALDWRVWVSLLALAVVLAGRKLIAAGAQRVIGRWSSTDQIEDRKSARQLTREERLELRVEEMASAQIEQQRLQYEVRLEDLRLHYEARLTDARAQMEALERERDVYRRLALGALGTGQLDPKAKREVAKRELQRTNPGLNQISAQSLEELTSDAEEDT